MKLKKIIISVLIITVIVVIITIRLVSVKQSFDKELKMVSESNYAIPILTDTVKYVGTADEFNINGSFSPSKEITITSETQGKVISINTKIGDKVVSGQVMASIDNQLFSSQLELAKFNLEKAEKNMKRYEQLSKGDAATLQQYESSKQVYETALSDYTTAQVQNDNAFIKAPFDGIVTKRSIEKGTYLTIGSPVFDIVEINKLKFIAKLTVDEAAKVQKGQSVKITVDTYPGITYDGVVSAVIVKADLSKRYDVEIALNNQSENVIKPDMFGTAFFSAADNEQKLVIPRIAIAGSIKNPEVFMVKGDSVVLQKLEITTLDDKNVLVNKGLKAGDIIVTSGQISLVNGSKIKINK
jgi:membrane fusion protein (multidrug efflux system)